MTWTQPHPDWYAEVAIRLPARFQEDVEAGLLEQGALGTAAAVSDATEVLVTGYFHVGNVPPTDRLESWLARLISPLPQDCVTVAVQPWRDWAAECRRSFRATQITRRLWIAPPWDVPADPGADLIVIEPGGAFGMGTHETTRGCLELLEVLPPPSEGGPQSLLDVGTGTGVLSLRALQLGIPRAVGFDHDPAALAAACTNRALNSWSTGLHLFAGDLAALCVAGTFDLVIANVILSPLLEHATHLVAAMGYPGWMVLSGFHDTDSTSIISRFGAAGLTVADRVTHGGWESLLLRR